MDAEYRWVGYVEPPARHPYLIVGEMPGRIPLALVDAEAGTKLAYFLAERAPQVGARVGVHGAWVVMDVPRSALAPEDRGIPGKPVQDQLEVESWEVVSVDYDPFEDLY